jgi:hypothetical protein
MFKTVDIVGKVLKERVIENAKKNAAAYAGRQKTNLSPSTDFTCMTKTFFNFKYSGANYLEIDADEFSYENERAKEIGNNFHNFIEKTLKSVPGVLKLSETTLVDEENHIRARLDMVVEINNELYLIELKSAKSYSLKMMNEEQSPDMDHQKQIQLYFHLYEKNKKNPEIFEILQGRPITKGIILYEDKDAHKITEFSVNKNQKLIDELLRYSNVLFQHINSGKQPEFKLESDSRECLYKCKPQYYQMCHGKTNPKKNNEKIPKNTGIWGVSEASKVMSEEKFI